MKRNYNSQNPKPKSTEVQVIHTLDICIKGILILFLLIAGTLIANAQVFNGQKDLNTQDAVDFLGSQGFTEISGLLLIRNSSDITDLSPLSSLTSVGGLIIEKNTALTNLNGLQNITTVGGSPTQLGLRINENTNLTDLSGLSGVQQVPDGVFITRNPLLTTLNGLQITDTAFLDISENNNLINLSGLNNVVSISNLRLIRNPVLTDLSSLSGIQQISEDVLITENQSLTTLSGLQFTSADRVLINGNNSLINLNGLQNLVSVTTILQIVLNPQLTDLSGLNSLTSANEIQITQNNALLAINGLTNLMAANLIRIENNTLLNNFCGLQPWAIANPTSSALSTPILNAYNPNLQQLINACDGNAPATTAIPDPAFEAALNALGLDNDPMPMQVLTADIQGVTNLDLTNLDPNNVGISDLTGIEAFAALENLTLDNNNLSTINITQNSNLLSLSLLDNNLSQIDISQNMSLSNLRLDQNNLTSIDLSNNSALEVLNLGGNQLNTINTNSNTLLEELYLGNNSISSLDLSTNSALKILVIFDNQFTDLTITNKPVLELIIASGNTIATTAFTNTPNLNTILLQDNVLTSIDASTLPSLGTLRLTNNSLTSLNVKNPALTNLSADGNPQLTCIEVDDLANAQALYDNGTWIADSRDLFNTNCSAISNIGDFVLRSQEEVDAFGANNFQTIVGSVLISEDGSGLPITNLGPLSTLTSISNELSLFANPSLTSLSGLDGITSLGSLVIRQNNALINLTGLSDLATIDLSMTIRENQNLQSFEGLNSITAIGAQTPAANAVGTVRIDDNASLIDITRLVGLTYIHDLEISNNVSIESLEGLQNVTAISGGFGLEITNNAALKDLNGLRSITNTGFELNISDNAALIELKGLENLLNSENFFLRNNPELIDISSLSNLGAIDNIIITNNIKLTVFCGLFKTANTAIAGMVINNNGASISQADIIANGACTNSCTIVSITDPEFKDFLLNNSFEDINGNFISIAQSGEICAELAATIVTLDLNSAAGTIDTFALSSLRGIEAFTELKLLNIGQDYQVLADVDVSQNLNLEILIASSFKGSGFNLQLTNNSKLKELYTYNSGSTLTINPTENPLLEVLRIGGFGANPFNQTTINLSAFTNLKEFWAFELGGITDLGLSNAPNLEKIEIRDTDIGGLDVSGSPLLNDITAILNFGLYDINIKNGGNEANLQNVSISDNSFVVTGGFGCLQVDNATYIESQVNLGNWSISGMEISENCLSFATTAIPDPNFEAELERLGYGDGIPNNQKVLTSSIEAVTNLVIQGLGITDVTGIEAFTALVSLEAEANSIMNIDVSNLVFLETLRLGGNQLAAIDLSSNTKLKIFEAANNNIANIDFSNNPDLEDIYLFDNAFQFLDVSTNLNLNFLTINGNPLVCVKVNDVSAAAQEVTNGNWTVDSFPGLFKLDCGQTPNTTIQFLQNTSSGFEVENSNLPQLVVNGTITNPSTVTLEDLTNGSATSSTTTTNGDYIFNGGNTTYTITIAPGVYDGTMPFALTDFEILDDFNYEGNETLNLQITGVSGDLSVGGITDFQYTILEDDYVVGIVADDDEASEAGDMGSFGIGLFDNTGAIVTNETGGDLVISYAFSGTAAASDFNSATTTAIIPQGDDSIFIPITAVDDSIAESSETVICTLIQGANYTLDNSKPQTDTLTILDNDSGGPTTFEAEVEIITDITNSTNVNEGNKDIELRMFIPGSDASNLQVSFDIEVVGSTATPDADFSSIPANETFTYDYFNDGNVVYTIAIKEDNFLENNEQFLIRISNPDVNGVQLKNANANGVLEIPVTIIDNESANAVLIGTDGIEGGLVQFIVWLQDADANPITNNTGADIDFDIQLTPGTATTPADYTNLGANTKITIGNLASGGSIEVPLLDDTEAEPEESLTGTISNPSLGSITIAQASTTVNIAASDNTGDSDSDGVPDTTDNCLNTPNADQADLDNDGQGDACDTDRDGDGVLNTEDTCPDLAGVAANNGCPQFDSDGDGIANVDDNCANMPNGDQLDTDADGIGDVCDTDIDGDGVPNINDNCIMIANPGQEDTDNDGIGDVCDTTDTNTGLTLNPGDLEVQVQAESCPDVANGSIVVLAFVDQQFTVTVTGTNLASPLEGPLNSSTIYLTNNLAAGSYSVCITADAFPAFEQCFVANVLNSDNISVDTQGIDLTTKTAAFNVKGSSSYTVQVNGKSYEYYFDTTKARRLEVPLETGENEVQIIGASDCQGIFKDTVFLGKLTAYPNPVVETLHLSGLSGSETAEINIVNLSGTVVRKISKESADSTLTINLRDLSSGIYVVFVKTATQENTIKIIKN